MLLPAAIFFISQMSFLELESAWWDCDTLYQQDMLKNTKYVECKKIDERFRTHFSDEEVFLDYWNLSKKDQWKKRGYNPKFEEL